MSLPRRRSRTVASSSRPAPCRRAVTVMARSVTSMVPASAWAARRHALSARKPSFVTYGMVAVTGEGRSRR